jgi:gas vesicle protein
MDDHKNRFLSMVGMFGLGLLIGAGTALLMAPQSGHDTRMMIKDKGAEIKDKAVSTVEDARDRTAEALDEVSSAARSKMDELKDRGEKVVQEQKEHLRDMH